MALCNNRLELYGYLEDQTDWFREPEFSGLLVILKIFPNAVNPVLSAKEVDRILDQKSNQQRLKVIERFPVLIRIFHQNFTSSCH